MRRTEGGLGAAVEWLALLLALCVGIWLLFAQ
jgi:hypothetical protein